MSYAPCRERVKPKNKQQVTLCVWMALKLQRHKHITYKMVHERFGVSIRTFWRAMRTLRAAGIRTQLRRMPDPVHSFVCFDETLDT